MRDFDGNLTEDLVVANETSNSFTFWEGVGDGTFRDRWNYPTGIGPYSVVAEDFNGDGKVDVALAVSGENGGVLVYLGNGDGTFGDTFQFEVGSEPHFVVAGDFNRDGQIDLAVANSGSDTVSVLYNNTR